MAIVALCLFIGFYLSSSPTQRQTELGGILIGAFAYAAFTSSYLELPVALFCHHKSRRDRPFLQQTCRRLVRFEILSVILCTTAIALLYGLAYLERNNDYLGVAMLMLVFIALSPLVLLSKVIFLIAGARSASRGELPGQRR
ncbi:MAG: hypothetical protein AAF289_13120 [Cyanobacteria bacterium P01_A01_bin.135]